MVSKSVKYSLTENVTIIESGLGTLLITNGIEHNGKPCLLIRSNKYVPIGEELSNMIKTSDEFNPDVIMLFNNEEGLNVLMKYLENVRKDLKTLKRKK